MAAAQPQVQNWRDCIDGNTELCFQLSMETREQSAILLDWAKMYAKAVNELYHEPNPRDTADSLIQPGMYSPELEQIGDTLYKVMLRVKEMAQQFDSLMTEMEWALKDAAVDLTPKDLMEVTDALLVLKESFLYQRDRMELAMRSHGDNIQLQMSLTRYVVERCIKRKRQQATGTQATTSKNTAKKRKCK